MVMSWYLSRRISFSSSTSKNISDTITKEFERGLPELVDTEEA
jgi:hypothetical protein